MGMTSMNLKDHNILNELFALSRLFLEQHRQTYERTMLPHFRKSRLSILIGQRGIGKTTFLIQKLLEAAQQDLFSHEILYIPTDHFLIGNNSLYDIGESFFLMGGKLIAFDEIHHYP